MSRKSRRSRSASGVSHGAHQREGEAVPAWLRYRPLIAGLWVLVFCTLFFIQDLPNNGGLSRLRVWQEVPFHLMNLIDPLPDQGGGAPSGFVFLSQRVVPLVVAALVLAAALGWGRIGWRLLRPDVEVSPLEKFLLAAGIGLSWLSLVTLGLGLAGLLTRWVFAPFAAAGLLAEMVWWRRKQSADRAERATARQGEPDDSATVSGSGLIRLCQVLIVPFVMAMVLGSLLPSTDFDVKEYHLQGPKEWYLDGQITFLPHNVYTSFPFLTEMLTLLAMVLTGDWFVGALAGKAVLMTFGLLSAGVVFAACRRWHSELAGWLAATVLLTTPWTYRISTIAYAEGGLSFFVVIGLFAVILLFERGGTESGETAPRCRLAGLIGVFAGSAMACKYTGLVQAVAPLGIATVLLPWWRGRQETSAGPVDGEAELAPPETSTETSASGPDVESGTQAEPESPAKQMGMLTLAFSLGVAIAIGPWLLKNLVQTGNPVYPLAWSIFGGRDWDDAVNARWKDAHSPDDYNLAGIPGWAFDVAAVNDWLSPLLYAFAPLALLVLPFSRRVIGLWVFAAYLFLTWWALTHRLDRFWVPMLPVIAWLAGMGAAWFLPRRGRTGEVATEADPDSPSPYAAQWKVLLAIVLIAAGLFNLTMVTSGASGYNAYLVDLAYARRWVSEFTTPDIAAVNRSMDEGQFEQRPRVLSVGEAAVFDARFPIVYNTVFDESIFEQWAAVADDTDDSAERAMRPPAEVQKILREKGITHVMINWQEILRYRRPGSYGYAEFIRPEHFRRLVETGVLAPTGMVSYRDWENVSEADRRVIEAQGWVPDLTPEISGRRMLVDWHVFRVR